MYDNILLHACQTAGKAPSLLDGDLKYSWQFVDCDRLHPHFSASTSTLLFSMDRFSDVDDLDMPMEPPAHAVHDTPAPIFAGAPGWKKDFCNNRREEAHSSLIHRHLYGRPYRELSGAYMVLRHLTRFGSHLGSGVSTQLCLHFKNEYDGAWAILLVNATY